MIDETTNPATQAKQAITKEDYLRCKDHFWVAISIAQGKIVRSAARRDELGKLNERCLISRNPYFDGPKQNPGAT